MDKKSDQKKEANLEDLEQVEESEGSLEAEEDKEERKEVSSFFEPEKHHTPVEIDQLLRSNHRQDEDTNPSYNTPFAMDRDSQRSNSKFVTWVLILVVILLMAGGIFAYQRFKSPAKPSADLTAQSSPTPSPSVKPILDRSQVSFEVLNGSGLTGGAKKAAAKLQQLGYQVVKIGNADRQNYSSTQVLISTSSAQLKENLDAVLGDLRQLFNVASVSGELKDSTASARLILGKS